ncbi:hypothetical protein JHK87_039710 [Glycine soja]|nr:hypothetical protein JHK87_039710 [Glycine soja]
MDGDAILGLRVCINDALTDDDVLHLILGRVERQEDKEVFSYFREFCAITDSDLTVIANHFPCLRVLNLYNCEEGLLLLHSLDVACCARVIETENDAGSVVVVAEGCHDL